MRWTLHGERAVYSSPWLDVRLADVELPDGRRFDHHLVRVRPAAGALCVDDQDRVLLIWRHRFIPDMWGWELPGGRVEPGEDLAEAAAREVLEETGWRPGPLTHLLDVRTSPGFTNAVHHIYRAEGAVQVGRPSDEIEAERVEWVPLADAHRLIARGQVTSASTMAGLLYLMTAGCGNREASG
jgi:8-oxo-dGTP pyrophosphatase MutT (NUDIX family)